MSNPKYLCFDKVTENASFVEVGTTDKEKLEYMMKHAPFYYNFLEAVKWKHLAKISITGIKYTVYYNGELLGTISPGEEIKIISGKRKDMEMALALMFLKDFRSSKFYNKTITDINQTLVIPADKRYKIKTEYIPLIASVGQDEFFKSKLSLNFLGKHALTRSRNLAFALMKANFKDTDTCEKLKKPLDALVQTNEFNETTCTKRIITLFENLVSNDRQEYKLCQLISNEQKIIKLQDLESAAPIYTIKERKTTD